MSICKFKTEKQGDRWLHSCEVCGGNFLMQAPVYVRRCRVAPQNPDPQFPGMFATSPCRYMGAEIRREICQLCGNRGKTRLVHACEIFGACTPQAYRVGQPEKQCRYCEMYSEPPGHLPEIPAGFTLPMPADLTPLPAGRDSFNGDEWKRLPAEHKSFYRALKKFRDHGEQPATATAAPAQPGDPEKTPFYSPAGKPVFLSHFGHGASAFIVLGGPSLLDNDLTQLQRRGIWTIGVNNVSAVVRTSAWCSVDSVSKFCDSIWQDPGITKFVNRRFLQRSVRTRKPDGGFDSLRGADGRPLLVSEFPGIIGVDRNADFEPSRWLSEPSINWGQSKKSAARSRGKYPQTLNSMFFVVKLVYALGFRVAYLLGCDFSMNPERPYAFPQTKNPGGVASNNNSYRKLNEMFAALQPHFLSAGFHVFNCNKTSGLTVFPHVSFSAAIAAATQRVPQNETGEGWYNGHAGD